MCLARGDSQISFKGVIIWCIASIAQTSKKCSPRLWPNSCLTAETESTHTDVNRAAKTGNDVCPRKTLAKRVTQKSLGCFNNRSVPLHSSFTARSIRLIIPHIVAKLCFWRQLQHCILNVVHLGCACMEGTSECTFILYMFFIKGYLPMLLKQLNKKNVSPT